jgi:hypothetical protein
MLSKVPTTGIRTAFITSLRQRISGDTVVFCQRCLAKAVGNGLTRRTISPFIADLHYADLAVDAKCNFRSGVGRAYHQYQEGKLPAGVLLGAFSSQSNSHGASCLFSAIQTSNPADRTITATMPLSIAMGATGGAGGSHTTGQSEIEDFASSWPSVSCTRRSNHPKQLGHRIDAKRGISGWSQALQSGD